MTARSDRSLKMMYARAAAAVAAAAPSLPAVAQSVAPAAAATLAAGPVVFGAPWMLLGMAALPALWWLMRSIPPKPEKVQFPAIRLLFDLKAKDQAPVHMPLWHKIMRTTAAAAIIAGLAQPQIVTDAKLDGDGPIVLVVDNGWSSARNWEARSSEMKAAIDRAARDNRPVILVPTASSSAAPPVVMKAEEARAAAEKLQPVPWPEDRKAAMEALSALNTSGKANVIWMSNGLQDAATQDFSGKLAGIGKVTVLSDKPTDKVHLLDAPSFAEDGMTLTVRRPDLVGEDVLSLTAYDEAGNIIGQKQASISDGMNQTRVKFDISPAEQRKIARVAIDGKNSAGAVVLVDEAWRPRPVGLVDVLSTESESPFLSEKNFIYNAVKTHTDVKVGDVHTLLKDKLSVLILPDSAVLTEPEMRRIQNWVREGGTLVRFSGPRLAARNRSTDILLPEQVRNSYGYAASAVLGKGGKVAAFDKSSPLHGLTVPANFSVERYLMAPGNTVDDRIWAKFQDGRPFVSSSSLGEGRTVLIHTTANAEWSNLALSGFFPDMMRAIIKRGQGVNHDISSRFSLPAYRLFDGHGKLDDPGKPLPVLKAQAIKENVVSATTPPGFYGTQDVRYAHNLSKAVPELKPLQALPQDYTSGTYGTFIGAKKDFSGAALSTGMAILLIDMMILLSQHGAFPALRRREKPAAPEPSQKPA